MYEYYASRVIMTLCFVGVWKYGLFSGGSYEPLPTLHYGLVCFAYFCAAMTIGFGIKKPKAVRARS